MSEDFIGSKLVLLAGDKLVVILRDDFAHIPYPNMWDMPGGGREGGESPEACVLRETREELGLTLSPRQLVWKAQYDSPLVAGAKSWWFAARLDPARLADIVFGDEGQRWALMAPPALLRDPRMIEHTKPRVRAGLAALAQLNG